MPAGDPTVLIMTGLEAPTRFWAAAGTAPTTMPARMSRTPTRAASSPQDGPGGPSCGRAGLGHSVESVSRARCTRGWTRLSSGSAQDALEPVGDGIQDRLQRGLLLIVETTTLPLHEEGHVPEQGH